jgi:hypothetical protein
MGTGSKPAIELEADEFAGFVLRKMGATLNEAQAAMSIISDERGSHTHPGRSLRLASIQTGWTHADEQSKGIVKAPSKESLLSKAGSPAKQTQVARYSFPKEYIYKTIHLYQFPKEQLLITVRSNLIKLDQKGYTVLGKLVNHNGNLYLVFEQGQYFRITDRGELLNNKNEMIGYLG